MIFCLVRAAFILVILANNLEFGSFIRGTWSSPLLLPSDLSLESRWIVCHQRRLVRTYLYFLYLVVIVSRRSTRTSASSSSTVTMSFCKAEVGNKPPSDADNTFMVIKCLKHVSFSENFKEGWWEKIPLSDSSSTSEPVSRAAVEQDCTLCLVVQIFIEPYDVGIDVVFPRICQ